MANVQLAVHLSERESAYFKLTLISASLNFQFIFRYPFTNIFFYLLSTPSPSLLSSIKNSNFFHYSFSPLFGLDLFLYK
ncbi:unnamed protein product [Meloidogyne enterolobii]|uniref:Uncharacterized protein n=1 Tax=Meloidogyne enterolobii TaxID=390850 RepID=A0ACB0ZES4_MELEN